MRGVILAGGRGTRLLPLTKITNKHLLPVYKKPMICYPLKALVTAGVTDILIVTGGDYAGGFIKLLGNGEDYKCSIKYAYQRGEDGIADALRLAEDFTRHEPFITILGDNFYSESLAPFVHNFMNQGSGARVLLKECDQKEELSQFGVPHIEGERITTITEKPEDPATNYVVTGTYMFDYKVWWYLSRLRPSDRGEYEVTDLLNHYAATGHLQYDVFNGKWGDMGTHDSLLDTAKYLAKMRKGIQ